MQPVAVSRYTLANCLGAGLDATLNALRLRRSGLAPCTFETARLDTHVGEIPAALLPALEDRLSAFECRNHRIAQATLAQDGFALEVERARQRYGPERVAVIVGTSTSGILETELAYRERDPVTGRLPARFSYVHTQSTYSLAAFVQAALSLEGPSLVISTACSSSAKVFGCAARMLGAGLCDAVVVGGSDSLCLTTLYGFSSLQLLSRSPCRPFDESRDGISIGEGAGFALLERPAATSGSGAVLLGVGESSDGYHMSSPHPEGRGARIAMEGALKSAGVLPDAVGYVNLHGTGTRSNDLAEGKAVQAVFGNRTAASSTKGWFGHTLGASGIQEAIVSLLAIEQGLIPGSVHTERLDPEIHIDYAIEARHADVRLVLSNSFGFGGSNCSLLFGRA